MVFVEIASNQNLFSNKRIDLFKEMSEMAANSSSTPLPSFGKIYYTRESVQRAFQSISDLFGGETSRFELSTSSSSASSASSKSRRVKSRPCLCWNVENEIVVVLLMTKFNGINPTIKQNDNQSIVANVSHENLLKHLLSIYPTDPLPDRRSITIEYSQQTKTPIEHENNCFLVLIPLVADRRSKWCRQFDGAIPPNDLRYIGERLIELEKEKVERKIANLVSEKMNLSSSSNSTIPEARTNDDYDDDSGESSDGSVNILIHRMKIDKDDIVHDWVSRCCNNYLNDPFDNGNSEKDFKFFLHLSFQKNSIQFSFSFSLRSARKQSMIGDR